LREEIDVQYELVGSSRALRKVLEMARGVARTNSTVLLRGESGTGKELIARYIHRESNRADGPFVSLNCAAFPETLLESELFGYEKGAFTGAVSRKKGKFELAHGGTLFLDEVGDIPLTTQIKLLRVLQEREFIRLGGEEPIRIDVRIIAATNQNLEQLITEKRFREDFYYRLNVFPIVIPPLRERREDIPILAEHFVRIYAKEAKKHIVGISREGVDSLLRYPWPGNVRELENVIERAIILAEGPLIEEKDLLIMPAGMHHREERGELLPLSDAVRRFKQKYVKDVLDSVEWNRAKAARILDIQPTYLSRLVKDLGITRGGE